ncbi:MAG: YdeI/OmpD-associated family protein [Calditrichia bacterium]
MEYIYFQNPQGWRKWLELNKKESGKPTLDYGEAVEEALCFGWIDSIIKNVDEQQYLRKFTPRKSESKWSELNKKRVRKMIELGRMTKAGAAKIEAAKKSGWWDKPDRPEISIKMPEDFRLALEEQKTAKTFFDQLAPTYQKQYILWIQMAKRAETRERRIKEAIDLLTKGEKLGLK